MKGDSKVVLGLTMFDMFKGVGILAVVFLHSINWTIQNQFGWKLIYSVLMPAFFIISGYWLNPKPILEGIKSSARQLLQPYLITLVIIEGIGLLHRLLTGNLKNWLQAFFIPGILGMSGPGTRFGPLWFLLALFWSWVLFYWTTTCFEEKKQLLMATLAGIVGGIWISYRPPFQLAQGLIGFFFLYNGFLMKKKGWLSQGLRMYLYLPMGFYWLLMVWLGTMDLGMYEVRYGFFSILGSLFGAMLVIRLFLYLEFLDTSWTESVRRIGRYTMWILCIHGLEGAVVPWNVLFHFVKKDTWAGCISWFILRCVVIGIGCVVLEQWNRKKIRRRLQREVRMK